ncbi:MAG: CDP-alcohol phosphatidyltransferase family protein [Caldilineaceae bacterium]
MVLDNRQNLVLLRWRWVLVTALYLSGLVLGYRFLRYAWQSGWEVRWLGLATLTMLLLLGIFWQALHYNHRPTETALLPSLGYGNGMTLARGLCTTLLAGFLFAPRPTGALAWVPALLYTAERLLDYFDGYVARRTGQATKLGAILDMEFDCVGFLLAVLLCIQYGQLPFWYVVLGLARYLFVGGIWLRQWNNKPVAPLPPSDNSRLIAGFQTTFVSVVLWPIITPQISQFAGYLFALPLCYSFGRDWLVVSHVLDIETQLYQTLRRTVKQLFEQWTPLAARVMGALVAGGMLWRAAPLFSAWAGDFGVQGLQMPPIFLFMLLASLWATATLLLLFGVLGRFAALALFCLAALDLVANGLHWTDNGLLFICTIIVLHLGSGHFALWSPDERWVRMKLGA